MSFGGGDSEAKRSAIDYAYAAGVTLIAAAGNAGCRCISYPAAYQTVLAISAFDHNDNMALFSSYGYWIDVASPGVSIYSTYFDDRYATKSGTSMAAPHVCGVAGLILSKNPSFSHEEVRQVLRISADDVDVIGWDIRSGHGRINADNSLKIFDAAETNPEIIKKTKKIIQDIDPDAWNELLRVEFERRIGNLQIIYG